MSSSTASEGVTLVACSLLSLLFCYCYHFDLLGCLLFDLCSLTLTCLQASVRCMGTQGCAMWALRSRHALHAGSSVAPSHASALEGCDSIYSVAGAHRMRPGCRRRSGWACQRMPWRRRRQRRLAVQLHRPPPQLLRPPMPASGHLGVACNPATSDIGGCGSGVSEMSSQAAQAESEMSSARPEKRPSWR